MRKEFYHETPELILILVDDKKNTLFEKAFQLGLDQLGRQYAALSIFIHSRHTKKMLTAIKLMDVRGIFLMGRYRRYAGLFTDTTPPETAIDTLVFKRGKYYATDSFSRAYKSYLDLTGKKMTHKKRVGKAESLFLAHLVAAGIRYMCNKVIDVDRLNLSIRRLRVN